MVPPSSPPRIIHFSCDPLPQPEKRGWGTLSVCGARGWFLPIANTPRLVTCPNCQRALACRWAVEVP